MHRQRDAVREMTAETDVGGGGGRGEERRQMGEDEKWSTWERQKDGAERKPGEDRRRGIKEEARQTA